VQDVPNDPGLVPIAIDEITTCRIDHDPAFAETVPVLLLLHAANAGSETATLAIPAKIASQRNFLISWRPSPSPEW
jgi:hypothetical protein